MNILLVFIDGLGLGEADPNNNPLVRYDPVFFRSNFAQPLTRDLVKQISASLCFIQLDASLGVDGLPQSATGQTTLFTGINAAKKLGRHLQAFPGPQLIKIIEEHGLFKQARAAGLTVTSANMYSPDYLELVLKRKRRHSVTTLLSLTAGVPLRSIAEMRRKEAVYQDITNEILPQFGVHDVEIITPGEAARRLISLSEQYDITVFEYFQTDRIGHKQNWETAEKIVRTLDEFLFTLQHGLSPDTTVLVTSDHGNFEDMSVKTHTYNHIPLIIFGSQSAYLAERIRSMTDITPTILDYLKGLKQID